MKRETKLKEKKILLGFNDMWDIIYKINCNIRTIIYTPKNDNTSKIRTI